VSDEELPGTPAAPDPAEKGSKKGAGAPSSRASSSLVAAGIFLSRISGLIRTAVFARYLGAGSHADVITAGLRMPNVLQNLLGEGTLSASFIPVYSELLEEGREEEATRFAGAIFGLLSVIAGLFALAGILLAPLLVTVLLPGFEGDRRELSIQVVRIIFPMTGFLVLSAWALGILNSHRKFFLSYIAPVAWNGAMIATLLLLGRQLTADGLVMAVAWGALLGGALQFLVQLPWVLRLEPRFRPSLNLWMAPVREAVRNAGPAIAGRGVVQISAWVDLLLASFLAAGAVAVIGYAQTLYLLPISLFGMSVAAAELPELSRNRSGGTEALRLRTNSGLEQIAFFVIPSFVAFVFLGDSLIAALLQRGEFSRTDTILVHLTLIGFSVGLVASTATRLFSSTFFALRDTRTPARVAVIRVMVAALLGLFLMTQFEAVPAQSIGGGSLVIPARLISWGLLTNVTIEGRHLGAVGLALGSGLAAWVEWDLLRRALRVRIGAVGPRMRVVFRMLVAALLATVAGWVVRLLIGEMNPLVAGVLIFSAYGIVYFGAAIAFRLPEADRVTSLLKRLSRRTG
jgi:putative peptidoglycan lipid II flippase